MAENANVAPKLDVTPKLEVTVPKPTSKPNVQPVKVTGKTMFMYFYFLNKC